MALAAPFFSFGETNGVGVSVGLGVGLGLGDGDSSGVADGEGDSVGFGVGEVFFFLIFPFGLGLTLGSGVGEAFALLCGDGLGDGVGLFFAAECLRCFRAGVGVGVAKIFLIFSPNESSAPIACALAPKPINKNKKTRTDVFKTSERRFRARVPAERPCSCASRLRDSRGENSR